MPSEVEAILEIPIGAKNNKDNITWHFEGKGNYSVKIGYRLGINLVSKVGPFNPLSVSQWWQSLWELDMSVKIKIFILGSFLRMDSYFGKSWEEGDQGIIICNSVGVVMASYAQFMDAHFDSTVAGIMALYKGLLFSLDYGLKPFVFESDKERALKIIASVRFLGENFGHILKEIVDLKMKYFWMEFMAIPVFVNRVAHFLARFGVNNMDNIFWMEEVPVSIRELVEADVLP
ncbi:hypothetical protein Ddye_017284 [Dipteronia dyeriana]|uniref:RNase H type-1 domain-containing protein n=1 Tax=Dipteronia dyeriana TaxID=168575 RepID=A0AAD9U9E4_9ROSI|nr:hypothetical protein Ddye_017284 [Dipteronia dyeriana]